MQNNTDHTYHIIHDSLARHIHHRFDSSVIAHDMAHLLRVRNNAFHISQSCNVNLIVIEAAAMLHDLHRALEKDQGRHVTPEEAESEVRNILSDIPDIPLSLHDAICDAINFTERFACAGDAINGEAISAEAKIVRDADMLDALGAVGIARAFMFGGYLGEPIWLDTSSHADSHNENSIFVPGKTTSVVHHFHEKLFQLEHEMLTEQGKQMAQERTRLMRQFIDTLMADMS